MHGAWADQYIRFTNHTWNMRGQSDQWVFAPVRFPGEKLVNASAGSSTTDISPKPLKHSCSLQSSKDRLHQLGFLARDRSQQSPFQQGGCLGGESNAPTASEGGWRALGCAPWTQNRRGGPRTTGAGAGWSPLP